MSEPFWLIVGVWSRQISNKMKMKMKLKREKKLRTAKKSTQRFGSRVAYQALGCCCSLIGKSAPLALGKVVFAVRTCSLTRFDLCTLCRVLSNAATAHRIPFSNGIWQRFAWRKASPLFAKHLPVC